MAALPPTSPRAPPGPPRPGRQNGCGAAAGAGAGDKHGSAGARGPALTVGGLLEVDIGVSERAAGDHVPADADGEDGPGGAELLVQHGLGHVGVQVPHVERGHGVAGGAGVHPAAVSRHGGGADEAEAAAVGANGAGGGGSGPLGLNGCGGCGGWAGGGRVAPCGPGGAGGRGCCARRGRGSLCVSSRLCRVRGLRFTGLFYIKPAVCRKVVGKVG